MSELNSVCLGQQVTHKKFGRGKIKAREGNTMTVYFAEYGARTFLYPQGFDSYLKADDPAFARTVQADLDAAFEQEADAELAHRKHVLEIAKQMKETRLAEKKAKSATRKRT